jgi:hypothetical protein
MCFDLQSQQQSQPERSFPPGYGYNRPPADRGRPAERRIPPDALRFVCRTLDVLFRDVEEENSC